jgi:murein L,D-transpeptidase YafK
MTKTGPHRGPVASRSDMQSSWVFPLLACATLSAAPMRLDEAALRMQAMAAQAGLSLPLQSPEIRIHKAPHTLELWASGRMIKQYPVGLGHRGLADKVREGDHLTPEGRFYLCSRNERSQFHLFLGISYPGEAAAEQGLKTGLITRQQHDAILRSSRLRACPPWNTRLGGIVGIHGGGTGADWTWGCIALEDSGIEELWVACPLGTPIIIEPK